MLHLDHWTVRRKCIGLTIVSCLLLLVVVGTGIWGIESILAGVEHMVQNQSKDRRIFRNCPERCAGAAALKKTSF